MTELAESATRSGISDLGEASIIEDISITKAAKSNEIIEMTTVGEKVLYFTEKTTPRTNLLTLAEVSKPSLTELSKDQIRQINRQVTRKITQREKDQIINERNLLVRKQFKQGLSTREENRLKYVRWQLDRIDDAETGEFLDYLEVITEGHEKFAKELQGLLGQMQNIQNKDKGRQLKKGKRTKGKR